MNSVHINSGPILFLGHDASRTGAPMALLHLLRWLKECTDLPFRIVLMEAGPLLPEFAAIAPTVVLTEVGIRRSSLIRRIGKSSLLGPLLKTLWDRLITPRVVTERPRLIYANTVATASVLDKLLPPEVPLVVHVHELERAIQIVAGTAGMAKIKSLARRYVACSSAVRQNLSANHGIDPSLIDLIPYFIPLEESLIKNAGEYRKQMRQTLGIPTDALVVGGCGIVSSRKGVDLFIEMAHEISTQNARVHFVWVGKVKADDFTCAVLSRVKECGIEHVCHFVGEHGRPVELFCGYDVFVLSSREDPMALVALEAAMVGKPIVCFAETGGIPDFVANECGRVVSPMTAPALAQTVTEVLSSDELRASLGHRASEKARLMHHKDIMGPKVVNLIKGLVRS